MTNFVENALLGKSLFPTKYLYFCKENQDRKIFVRYDDLGFLKICSKNSYVAEMDAKIICKSMFCLKVTGPQLFGTGIRTTRLL